MNCDRLGNLEASREAAVAAVSPRASTGALPSRAAAKQLEVIRAGA
jgi:hypothetical protein